MQTFLKIFISTLLLASPALGAEDLPSQNLRELLEISDENCELYQGVLIVDLWGVSGQEVIENQLLALKNAAKRRLPIILVEYKCKTAAPIAELLDSLPEDYPLLRFHKITTDAFYQTVLKEYLTLKRLKCLLVMGGRTNVCIRATVETGISNGFHFIGAEGLLEGGFPNYAAELDGGFRIFNF